MADILPPPCDLGMPERFDSWYNRQDEAVSWIMDQIFGTPRFIALNAPTGSGKTLIATLCSILSGKRTVVLTATKALQNQYSGDMGDVGISDLRGAISYRCTEEPELSAEEAYCRAGFHCNTICAHRKAVQESIDPSSRIILTNYFCWMAHTRKMSAFWTAEREKKGVDLLILDEAHQGDAVLSDFCSIEFGQNDFHTLGVKAIESRKVEDWRSWGSAALVVASKIMKSYSDEITILKKDDKLPTRALIRAYREISGIVERLTNLYVLEGEWVVGSTLGGVKLSPVWPKEYSEDNLFHGVKKIILMSATLTPKTLELLGIKDYVYKEIPSSFPVKNRPVIHVPTVRLNHRATEEDLNWWVTRIDQIIDARLDRKGIIHTVSYQRRNLVLAESRHRKILMTHGTGDLQSMVDRFKNAKPPAVMVSPSLQEGYDFPYDACSYVVIGKIPYPDTRDPITKARMEGDPDWAAYYTMQMLVQSAGRGVRAPDDKCEVLLIDDNFRWFFKKYRDFAPSWFAEAVRFDMMLPKPFF